MKDHPRVTLGIATYNRDTYLAEAIQSCLSQDYESLEVLVVVDGATNPGIDVVIGRFTSDPRFRVVRHDRNLGISEAYNTIVREGRGELIAMLGDDDVALPGRIRREVEIFDRFPDTGVVHGDATVIDARGKAISAWNSIDFPPGELVRCFYRNHDYIVDPSRMVHRRVYEQSGGYDPRYRVAQDFEFWMRAAQRFRFRHCGDGPVIKLRRHGDNGSDESQRGAETAEVEAILREGLERYSLRVLEPELDWSVLSDEEAERQALLRLADQVERRGVPTPQLARELRDRAVRTRPTSTSARNGRRLLMTMFGWNDSGGGTILPRLIAKELVRRGWEVSVFHAATAPLPAMPAYSVREWSEDGVRLVGVHNRPSMLYDVGNPSRDLDDPAIRAAFARELDNFRPDVVHFHNLHNLGASLTDEASIRGLRSYLTTHNYWLICPRVYLLHGTGAMCEGPGDGTRCAACTSSGQPTAERRRLSEIRARVQSGITRVLAISESVRSTLVATGYSRDAIDVVRQAMPHESDIWAQVGSHRAPGRLGDDLVVGFLGSVYTHKGPQLLVEAAQRTTAKIKVKILGEVPSQFAASLRALDIRGVVDFAGRYSPSELPELLAGIDAAALPSTWWDCANLAAEECHAARVPLLVPRLGGLVETVRNGIDGLTFNGLDVEDLAAKLDLLAADAGLLETLQAGIEPPDEFSAHVDVLESYYRGERDTVEPPALPTPLEVRWKGDHGQPTSLSIINDQVTSRLPYRVQRVSRAGDNLDGPLSHGADVEVRHQWPPDFSVPPAGRLATIVPWEFGSIPKDWIDGINANVDELWVPSEYVRNMYVDDGIEPERVHVIPNGVDLDTFYPADLDRSVSPFRRRRFLYVGGITARKGIDLLLDAWDRAFAGRDDVVLVVKAALAGGAYGGSNETLLERAASGRLPALEVIEDDLDPGALADLYRSCDVFVLPYRGEGFAMPVLEAMACGLPVITTAGGPTDEFCPPESGWRIRSRRQSIPLAQLGGLDPLHEPWVLEPDVTHFGELLGLAAGASHEELAAKGQAGRAAAESYGWDTIASRYQERIVALSASSLRISSQCTEPFPLSEDVDLRILATPAWRGNDRLADLLRGWVAATTPATSACLYLLADPATAGTPEEIEAHIREAAATAGVELDGCADINVLVEPFRSDRDQRLHRSVDVYVPLHAACLGHERMARKCGSLIVPAIDHGLVSVTAPDKQSVER